ncbi:hypothetical protein [Paracoccus sp. IB05]|uniref:hypothetical protein n=1 Tax=Paracoccus sp. IB05 TaxID=2779367 RepID=UPI0018E7E674|nr:hypothetical protein [Paracoccus sp. IB05]MBJ2152670.1 hypothetical protein [Paracoccus sp. IB05]
MDYIKEDLSIPDQHQRIALWAWENFERPVRHDELGIDEIDNPVAFALKLQADPERACDLWARMIRHAYRRAGIFRNEIIIMKEVGRAYPKDFDRFEPTPGEVITGSILSIWPRFMGHEVVLCLFDGMNPRDGLMILDGDPEATALLRQISDATLHRIFNAILAGHERSGSHWLRALCETEPLTDERADAIRAELDHSGQARDLIAMIRACQAGKWSVSPISPAYVRDKLAAIREAI